MSANDENSSPQMQDALRSATSVHHLLCVCSSDQNIHRTVYTSGPSFRGTPGTVDHFTAGFMYGWADAKNGQVPHEHAKKEEREIEYAKVMKGTDNEGAFGRGCVYLFGHIRCDPIENFATSYSEGWNAQKSLP